MVAELSDAKPLGLAEAESRSSGTSRIMVAAWNGLTGSAMSRKLSHLSAK
jgi:hypothetical protein